MATIELKDALANAKKTDLQDGVKFAATYTDAATKEVSLTYIDFESLGVALSDLSQFMINDCAYAQPYSGFHGINYNTKPYDFCVSFSNIPDPDKNGLVKETENYSKRMTCNTFYNLSEFHPSKSRLDIDNVNVNGVILRGDLTKLTKQETGIDYSLFNQIFGDAHAQESYFMTIQHLDLACDNMPCANNYFFNAVSTYYVSMNPDVVHYYTAAPGVQTLQLGDMWRANTGSWGTRVTYFALPKKFTMLDTSNFPAGPFYGSDSVTDTPQNFIVQPYIFSTYVDTIDLSMYDFTFATPNDVTSVFGDYKHSGMSTYVSHLKFPRNFISNWCKMRYDASTYYSSNNPASAVINLTYMFTDDYDALNEIANWKFPEVGTEHTHNKCTVMLNTDTLCKLTYIAHRSGIFEQTNGGDITYVLSNPS